MELNLYLLLALLIALLVIGYLLAKLHRVRGQLSLIKDALADIKNGNLNRRVLARESNLTKQICYDINEIAMSSQSRIIQQKQSEQAYKRLMTSLSHDVKNAACLSGGLFGGRGKQDRNRGRAGRIYSGSYGKSPPPERLCDRPV